MVSRSIAALCALLALAGVMRPPALASTPTDRVQVVATIPDLADIARRIGGDRVEVQSIARGRENVHNVRIRPSHLVAMSRADLFIEVGLSLEHAWVPGLLEAARNKNVRPGQSGFVNVSIGWEPIEVPTDLSRTNAVDIHPDGNPHINLDPAAGEHMAAAILDGLIAVDPAGREDFEKRHAAFLEELAEARERWDEVGERIAGGKIVAFHREFSYFARAFGLEVVDYIEARPGVPPSPGELTRTVERMREAGATVILTAAWSNGRAVRSVADRAGARVHEVPTMVGGADGVDTWIGLIDHMLNVLDGALATDDERAGS